MDKYLCRKDVYDELEKAMRDRSHLTEKVITDKNGHQRKVLVRAGEDPKKQKTKKGEEPTEKKTKKIKTPLDVIEHVVEYGGDIKDIKSQKLLKEAHDLSLRVANPTNDPNYDKKLTQFRQDCKQRIRDIINGKTESSEPKHEVGSMVHLDEGVAGSFKVDSIDKDGSYHVVSDDGRKYHVSENHLSKVKDSDKKGKTMFDRYGRTYTVDSEGEDGYVHVKDSKGNNKRIHNSELKEDMENPIPTKEEIEDWKTSNRVSSMTDANKLFSKIKSELDSEKDENKKVQLQKEFNIASSVVNEYVKQLIG